MLKTRSANTVLGLNKFHCSGQVFGSQVPRSCCHVGGEARGHFIRRGCIKIAIMLHVIAVHVGMSTVFHGL